MIKWYDIRYGSQRDKIQKLRRNFRGTALTTIFEMATQCRHQVESDTDPG